MPEYSRVLERRAATVRGGAAAAGGHAALAAARHGIGIGIGGAPDEGEEQPRRFHELLLEEQDAAEGSWKQLKLHADELTRGSGERWKTNLAALKAYVEENGGRYPPWNSACAAERKLNTWCTNQRSVRRGTVGGVISTARQQQLEQVRGWSWGVADRATCFACRDKPAPEPCRVCGLGRGRGFVCEDAAEGQRYVARGRGQLVGNPATAFGER